MHSTLDLTWIFEYFLLDMWIFEGIRMPLYIKDNTTADLVTQLAKLRGLTKQDAVRLAVQAELDRAHKAIPLRARVQALRAAHPLPPPTGKTADKDFFDELSGKL
jgi:antitoxin VapB